DDKVAWISIGALRFSPEIREVILRRKEGITILKEPFVLHEDRKFRYHHQERIKLFRTIHGFLRQHFKKADIYLCMENRQTWDEVFGSLPDKESILWNS
ncbi:MAG: DNA photolyase, partial [Nitrospinae bacterium]|nr:DNA photolyase [Nitrospinota bacterium]